ncbi:MAG: bifunctional adenosylcobinamide kinase/adenosylcobinamide-phosphate guanylyltransferase [Acutalibacteraceae bacterium]
MLTFIFGGSASGKSEYAEQYAASLAHNCNAPLLYLATMCANDTESKQRIERHRRMRADKSFQTMEVSKEIGSIVVESDSVVLLECLSNLLANEMFSSNTTAYSVSSVLQQINLQDKLSDLIVVSMKFFSDGICMIYLPQYYRFRISAPGLAALPTKFMKLCGIPILIGDDM